MSETLTLSDFLLARIAEDEETARVAIDPERPGAHWQWMDNETDGPFDLTGENFRASLRTVEEFPTRSLGDLPAFPLGYVEAEETYALPHIARHDPARVLAECEAKRRIVEPFEEERQRMDIYNRDYALGLLTTEGDLRARASANARWAGLDVAVRLLALPYADHPDYREEWKP